MARDSAAAHIRRPRSSRNASVEKRLDRRVFLHYRRFELEIASYGMIRTQIPKHGKLIWAGFPGDFSNLPYHSILDWRLGLDLARLALDSTAPIDFSVPCWRGLDAAAATPYFAAMPGWQQVTFGGLHAGRRGNQAEIITHPLWDCDPNRFGPQLSTAYAHAAAVGCQQVRFKSVFEVLRRPF